MPPYKLQSRFHRLDRDSLLTVFNPAQLRLDPLTFCFQRAKLERFIRLGLPLRFFARIREYPIDLYQQNFTFKLRNFHSFGIIVNHLIGKIVLIVFVVFLCYLDWSIAVNYAIGCLLFSSNAIQLIAISFDVVQRVNYYNSIPK